MVNKNTYVLVLASGGIDSTACINFYKKLGFYVETIFVDYGQKAKLKELGAIDSITKHFEIKLNIVNVKSEIKFGAGEILGRNAFLIFTALLNFPKGKGIIALGIHNGTPYYDSSNEFINQMQVIMNKYSHGTIKIGAPFLNFNKKEICEYFYSEKIPIHLTYSCELGKKQPCGQCATCKDLEVIYACKK